MGRRKADAGDEELREVLEQLLVEDLDITARAVTRRHSRLANASAVVRSPERSALLKLYQERQAHTRSLVRQIGKRSSAEAARMIEDRDQEIMRLKENLAVLVESHRLMLVAMGELGGTRKLAQLYERHRETREKLAKLHAIR